MGSPTVQMLTSLVEYLTVPISLFFCGKLGKTELAAAGLAVSLFHTAGVSFIMGFLTAGETLFAQVIIITFMVFNIVAFSSTGILLSIACKNLKSYIEHINVLKISLTPKPLNEVFTCKLWLGRGFRFWLRW